MPRGGHAPDLSQTEARHIYQAMLTGPGNMDNFSDGNLSPEEKRDVIAYLYSLREQPAYGGFTLGGLGPVSEGLFAWVVGIGAMVGFAIWIAGHTTRSTKQKEGAGGMTDLETHGLHAQDGQDGHHLPALEPDDPITNPGLPEHTWRPTDVDPAQGHPCRAADRRAVRALRRVRRALRGRLLHRRQRRQPRHRLRAGRLHGGAGFRARVAPCC